VGHSMGGLALRWYVTDGLMQRSAEPRYIRYPMSAEVTPDTVPSSGFPALQTDRAPEHRFRRPENFMRGDIRKIVTTGSPQLGSPLANYVTHEVCKDSRDCYTDALASWRLPMPSASFWCGAHRGRGRPRFRQRYL